MDVKNVTVGEVVNRIVKTFKTHKLRPVQGENGVGKYADAVRALVMSSGSKKSKSHRSLTERLTKICNDGDFVTGLIDGWDNPELKVSNSGDTLNRGRSIGRQAFRRVSSWYKNQL